MPIRSKKQFLAVLSVCKRETKEINYFTWKDFSYYELIWPSRSQIHDKLEIASDSPIWAPTKIQNLAASVLKRLSFISSCKVLSFNHWKLKELKPSIKQGTEWGCCQGLKIYNGVAILFRQFHLKILLMRRSHWKKKNGTRLYQFRHHQLHCVLIKKKIQKEPVIAASHECSKILI